MYSDLISYIVLYFVFEVVLKISPDSIERVERIGLGAEVSIYNNLSQLSPLRLSIFNRPK